MSLSLSDRVQTPMASSSRNPSYTTTIHESAGDDLSISPSDQLQFSDGNHKATLCSPKTHSGSRRCKLHKVSPSMLIILRQSAIANSIGQMQTPQGITTQILPSSLYKRRCAEFRPRPSSLYKRRCDAFRPRPSRLSLMSKAEDL